MLKPISQYIFLNRKVYSDSIGTLCHWWWRVLILSSSISLAKHSKEIQVQYTLGLWPGAHSCFSRNRLTWSVNQAEHHVDLLTHRRNDFHITVEVGYRYWRLSVLYFVFGQISEKMHEIYRPDRGDIQRDAEARITCGLIRKKNERALEGNRTPEPWVIGRQRINWA